MNEKLKGILDRIVGFWKGLTGKQRMLIISSAVAVIITFVILGTVLSRPNMTNLINCESQKQAAQVVDLLNAEGIRNEVSDDGLRIQVEKSRLSDASLLLGANDLQASRYTIDNVTDGMTSTESDKQKRYAVYLEQQLEADLENMEPIKEAKVKLTVPEKDGTLIAEEKDTSASVTLTLVEPIDADIAANLARSVATAVGNKTTQSVTILDNQGNMLFNGDSANSESGSASTQLSTQRKAEEKVNQEVKKILLGTQVYDDATVATKLQMDFDDKKETVHEFYPPDGQSQGLLKQEDTYESEATNGVAGVPGTDTNGEESYQLDTNGYSSSAATEQHRTYSPNERIMESINAFGKVDYDNSSLSITTTEYVFYYEQRLEEEGALDNMTFEEYQSQNNEKVKVDVDPEHVTLVSRATGIAEENIQILSYQVPYFVPKDTSSNVIFNNIIQIILLVLISALLLFVVIKGTRPVVVEETEPELSVEALLKTTKESQQLEDIDYDDRSEVRKMIDNFVDENPEAVSALLRGWLNEDWED